MNDLAVKSTTTLANRESHSLVERREKVARYLAVSSKTDSTQKTYRSALRSFLDWGGMLPTTPSEVIDFLVDRADTHSINSLDIYIAALRSAHIDLGFNDPTDDKTLQTVLKGIKREKGKPVRKAHVFSPDELACMASILDDEALVGARDKAILLVGYYGAFRRSELAGLTREMLVFQKEGLVITLTRSKTDQAGKGLQTAIPFIKNGHCPVKAIENWLLLSGIEEGAVFRNINRWGDLGDKALSPESINYILKRTAQKAGLSCAGQVSGHSLRRSLVTHAFRNGASFEAVKKQGNWKSDSIVREYKDSDGLFENNVVNSLADSRAGE